MKYRLKNFWTDGDGRVSSANIVPLNTRIQLHNDGEIISVGNSSFAPEDFIANLRIDIEADGYNTYPTFKLKWQDDGWTVKEIVLYFDKYRPTISGVMSMDVAMCSVMPKETIEF